MRTLMPVFLIIILLATLAPETYGEQEPVRLTRQQRSLQPGEAVLIRAESSRPLVRASAEAFGSKFPLLLENGGLRVSGLIGIDLDVKPGKHPLTLTAVDTAGKEIVARETLEVIDKQFPTRRLTVEQKYVTPPAEVLARISEERARVNAIFAATSPERLWSGPFLRPVPGAVISAFGKRSIYNNQPRSPHAGVDFRGATGTPVRAPNSGRIVLASNLYYSGNTVIIDHGLGMYSYFGHLSSFGVKEGDRVKSGAVVGRIGATGVVTGPHLHWTVRIAGARVDPMSVLAILSEKTSGNTGGRPKR